MLQPLVLARLLPKIRARKEKNLLSSSNEVEDEVEEEPETWALHCELYILLKTTPEVYSSGHSNLTLTLVSDNPTVPYTKLPPALTQCRCMFLLLSDISVALVDVKLVPGHRGGAGQGAYWPILFTNDFWQASSISFRVMALVI